MNTNLPLNISSAPGPKNEHSQSALMRWLKLWFGLHAPVGQRAYALTGFSLMIFKYGVDASVIHAVTGKFFSPLAYLNPLISMRTAAIDPAPSWLMAAMAAWTLPFMWVGVSMSVRRAIDAGRSAWLGTLFLVPLINYVTMLILCFLPTRVTDDWPLAEYEIDTREKVRSALLGIACGIAIVGGMTGFGVYVLGEYGVALFFGTPFLVGLMSAYLYNHGHPHSYSSTLAVSAMSIVLSAGGLLLFALEGVICILMALPIAVVAALLGSLVGRAIAVHRASPPAWQALMPLMILPLLAGVETKIAPKPLFEVFSAIEIDAPPEKVWPHVIGFSDLPEPEAWFFRAGIAYPQRARLVGQGVGAMRYCEFSTGPFVEPITVWDAPHRLAFDVTAQPPTMHELSPYRYVHPPHLDGALRSRHGEFRLVALPNNHTRLEGRTWYEFEMYPQTYWTLWSDELIHRIHLRVLRHIKQLSESS